MAEVNATETGLDGLSSSLNPNVENSSSSTFDMYTTWYKLRASCTSEPSGYITWINTTGDNSGIPTCGGVLGPTTIVAQWLK